MIIISLFLILNLSSLIIAENKLVLTDLNYNYGPGDFSIYLNEQTINASVNQWDGGSSTWDNETEYENGINYSKINITELVKIDDNVNISLDYYLNNTDIPDYQNVTDWDLDHDENLFVNNTQIGILNGYPLIPKDVGLDDLIDEDFFVNIMSSSFMSDMGFISFWDDLTSSGFLYNDSSETNEYNATKRSANGNYLKLNNLILNITTGPNPEDWFLADFNSSLSFKLDMTINRNNLADYIKMSICLSGKLNDHDTQDLFLLLDINFEMESTLVYDSNPGNSLEWIILSILLISIIIVMISFVFYYQNQKVKSKYRKHK